MKVSIKGILKESKEDVIEKISKSLEKPYFKDLKDMGIPENLWDDIFSNMYDREISILTKNDGNLKEVYFDKEKVLYLEYIDDHHWVESKYDKYGNIVYAESSEGLWEKYTYDFSNGIRIYREDSDGYWEIKEFDDEGNLIYNENSRGILIGSSNIDLHENVNHKSNLISRVSKIIQKPYFKDLINMDIPKGLWKDIFSNLFNQKVIVDTINYDGYGVVDKNSEIIYFETDNGTWQIYEHNEYGNLAYYYNSKGEWARREYDEYGKQIYFINDRGQVIDKRSKNTTNESVDRLDRFYDSIAKILLDETKYDIEEKNYGLSIRTVSITFPMYPWSTFGYTQWDIEKWANFNGYGISHLDLNFVMEQYGVNVDSAEIIIKKYIKMLSLEILEKMG